MVVVELWVVVGDLMVMVSEVVSEGLLPVVECERVINNSDDVVVGEGVVGVRRSVLVCDRVADGVVMIHDDTFPLRGGPSQQGLVPCSSAKHMDPASKLSH